MPYSQAVDYGELEVADANFIEMKEISLPLVDGVGCVYLKDVPPENMIAQYTNPEDGSISRTHSAGELTLNKRCLIVKPES